MRRNTALASIALTALAVTGAAVAPAQAAPLPSATPATATAPATDADAPGAKEALPASAAAKTPSVKIAMDQLGRGNAIADAIRSVKTDNRGTFVQEAVNKAFDAAGGRHNVMLFNLSQGYQERLHGKRVYANVQWGNIYYGLWISESGEFTNTGDGGWINWGFRGWFDRNGGHVTFHRSW
ncbi:MULTISPECIES: stress protein [unclassified Streptomyces]|uniref:stress protein n=1 Tax=unclassified Streptomyces TaxID=2593676 RepID=UPI00380672EB